MAYFGHIIYLIFVSLLGLLPVLLIIGLICNILYARYKALSPRKMLLRRKML